MIEAATQRGTHADNIAVNRTKAGAGSNDELLPRFTFNLLSGAVRTAGPGQRSFHAAFMGEIDNKELH